MGTGYFAHTTTPLARLCMCPTGAVAVVGAEQPMKREDEPSSTLSVTSSGADALSSCPSTFFSDPSVTAGATSFAGALDMTLRVMRVQIDDGN